jgi:hypothetical protein
VLQSLARADLGRLDRLLRSLRRNGPPRPLAILAKAVLDLAAGRLDGARSSLAALAKAGASGAIPPRLLADLETLAQDEPDRPGQDDAYPRAAAELFTSLEALEARALAPTAAACKTLSHCLETLRGLARAEELDLRRLLDDADRCLSLLDDLEALESALSRLLELPDHEARTREGVVAWIRRTGPALSMTLGATVPALLAPLHHVVAMRWRSILERVVARLGSPGLTALWSADPRLLAYHVDLPGGAQGGQEVLRRRAQAQQLLAKERYLELADLLRSRGRTASEAGDLAALWSLELWARRRTDESETEDDLDLLPDLAEPLPHRTLVRLGEMAGEIGRRIPAEQRAGVARVLSDELFDLGDEVGFCDHTAGAALSLLEHRPGEPSDMGLLLAGVAGALAADAHRALRALQAHLDRSGKVTAGHQPIARRLMAQIAREAPWALARILDALRPLFPDDLWPEIAELVAREMRSSFAEMLNEASFAALRDPEFGDRVLRATRKGLDSLRPALAGTPGFGAVELALDCWRPERMPVAKRLARFLAAYPGWEAALAALQVLVKASGPGSPKDLDLVVRSLAQAVIDGLDDRWQLWCQAVPLLAFAADRAPLKLLEKKVRQLLASPEVEGEDHEVLAASLQAIHQIGNLRDEPDHPRQRAKGAKRGKKPRRRSGDTPQIGLDFP